MTSNSDPRILLMGCGSVGGVIAAGLLRKGYNLTIVTHNEAISKAIETEGLRVITPEGRRTVPVAANTPVRLTLAPHDGPFDIALLAMKATEVESAAEAVAGCLALNGCAVTLQNGIVEDRVAEILGARLPPYENHPSKSRVIGALVGWGATMHTPGLYEMTSRGELTIGELDHTITRRVRRLKAVLDNATPTTISTNIYGALWSKLAINCGVTTLGALTGQTLGQMLRRSLVRRLALILVSEVLDVAEAHGVALEPVGGTLDLTRLYLSQDRRSARFGLDLVPRHLIMAAVALKFRRLKSSMLQSLERGRPPEIEFMNAYVVERGREKHIPTPANAALTQMVREIASGTREISARNLLELDQRLRSEQGQAGQRRQ